MLLIICLKRSVLDVICFAMLEFISALKMHRDGDRFITHQFDGSFDLRFSCAFAFLLRFYYLFSGDLRRDWCRLSFCLYGPGFLYFMSSLLPMRLSLLLSLVNMRWV